LRLSHFNFRLDDVVFFAGCGYQIVFYLVEHAFAIVKLTLRVEHKLDARLLLDKLAEILTAAQLSNLNPTLIIVRKLEEKVGLFWLRYFLTRTLFLDSFLLR
jgi:hypothetical protein